MSVPANLPNASTVSVPNAVPTPAPGIAPTPAPKAAPFIAPIVPPTTWPASLEKSITSPKLVFVLSSNKNFLPCLSVTIKLLGSASSCSTLS